MDFLKSAVASAISKGPLAAYTVGDTVELEPSIWTLNNGVRREGSLKCSIFAFDITAHKSRLPVAKNAVRKFRTLRHPGLVQVLDTIETDTHIYIITERVTPLAGYTRSSHISQEARKWGLWNIAKTIKFINEEAASVHCLLRASSVFASESGEWKLGGFELLTSTKEEDHSILNTHSSVVPRSGDCLPPETASKGWEAYKFKSTPWSSVDAYGYSVLVSEVFNGSTPVAGQAPQAGNLPPELQQIYRRLVNPNPKMRLSVSQFLDQGRRSGGFFQTPLINLTESIDSLGLKSEGERDEFLKDLHSVSDGFPSEYLKHRVLPELLKSVEFGGGGPKVFTVVLQIGAKLSDDEYETQLTPVLVRLFSSPDRAIRVCLLDNLPIMIDHLPAKIVNDKIFPNLVTGFTDVAPLVREQTVKAVLTIISKLSDRIINGELLKYLAKTANDMEPGIRTNTTVCLGKIAKYLGPGTKTKVLIAAFTRSLRDPFVHARSAALMALGATVEMFSEDDCATRILPCICPSLVDKEKIVRDQANKAHDLYLARIRKFSLTLPDTITPRPTSASEGAANTPRASTPSMDSGWTGWAISSFTNRFAAGDVVGQLESKTNGVATQPQTTMNTAVPTTSSAPSSRPSSTAPPTSKTTPVSTARPLATSRQVSHSSKLAQSFVAPDPEEDGFWDNMDDGHANATADDDAWGAMEDDDGDAFFDAPAPASTSNRSSGIMSASAAAGKPSASSATSKFDDGGEPDFAGWLKAQQSQVTKKKAPLPKGLPAKAPAVAVTSAPPRPSSAGRVPGTAASAVRKGPVSAVAVKNTVPAKKLERKQETNEDDGWGDAWD